MVIAQLIFLDLPVNHLRQLALRFTASWIFFDGKQFFGFFFLMNKKMFKNAIRCRESQSVSDSVNSRDDIKSA